MEGGGGDDSRAVSVRLNSGRGSRYDGVARDPNDRVVVRNNPGITWVKAVEVRSMEESEIENAQSAQTSKRSLGASSRPTIPSFLPKAPFNVIPLVSQHVPHQIDQHDTALDAGNRINPNKRDA